MKTFSVPASLRRGKSVLVATLLSVLLLVIVAIAVESRAQALVQAQLQGAVKSAALAAGRRMARPQDEVIAAAQRFAAYHPVGKQAALGSMEVEFGSWNASAREFVPAAEAGNAVRVTATPARAAGGGRFWAGILGGGRRPAAAVALASPRDIALVVDLPTGSQALDGVRRALSAALNVLQERNRTIPDPMQRDWVSLVALDAPASAAVVLPLTSHYDQALQACTRLQPTSHEDSPLEAGLLAAHKQLRSAASGGRGRWTADKLVVLLTDGAASASVSTPAQIDQYLAENPDPDYYVAGAGSHAKNAALMQARRLQLNRWQVSAVGLSQNADRDFTARLSRLGGTATISHGSNGTDPGDPAPWLADVFRQAILNPTVRLVE